MDMWFDHVTLSRVQFGLTALFHILWPVLTVGLSLFLVVVETLWLRTRDTDYYYHARFWSKLLLLNFGIGVVSGVPLEFQFGTNWSGFAVASGDFMGNILGFEAAMAFMLEAGFIGIMMFGWQRVAPGIHLFATVMVAIGASLSAFWIMAASAWMQTPAGVHLEQGRFVVDSYFDAIFNPAMLASVAHMWVACLETSLFVIGGISAWYLLRGRDVSFFLKSFKLAVIGAGIVTPAQIIVGDASGLVVAEHQPAKLAASEAHWETNSPGTGAAWSLLAWPDPDAQRNRWAIEIPAVLSLLTTHSFTGRVAGLKEFARADQPPVLVPFYVFRIMMAVGFWLLLLTVWTLWRWRRGRALERERRLLGLWLAALPLGYIAVEAGWLLREVGRQPWVVHGLVRTADAASALPAGAVAASLFAYLVIYGTLLMVFLVFARRLVRHGPDLTTPVHPLHASNPMRTAPETTGAAASAEPPPRS
jgi:cytochrome d ubiquinol oxidase subunit I